MSVRNTMLFMRGSAKQLRIGRWLLILLLMSPIVLSIVGCDKDQPDPSSCSHPLECRIIMHYQIKDACGIIVIREVYCARCGARIE